MSRRTTTTIELRNYRLTLRGERKHETEVKEERYHRRERAYGSFQRTFQLPTTIDPDKIRATFQNGILEWWLPKREAAKSKRIAISGAEAPTQITSGARAAEHRGATKPAAPGR